MSFKTQAEIYQALLDGKKIINNYFIPGTYIFLRDGKLIFESGKPADFSFLEPSIWSLYEEPKKKVKMWQALVKTEHGVYHSSNSFYSSEDDAKKWHGNRFIKLLPHTEIEVEE